MGSESNDDSGSASGWRWHMQAQSQAHEQLDGRRRKSAAGSAHSTIPLANDVVAPLTHAINLFCDSLDTQH